MKIEINGIDSMVMGKKVLELDEFTKDEDFISFEKNYLQEYDPVYVVCKIPVEDLERVHLLESYGFNFIEFQVKSMYKLKKTYDTSKFLYDFFLVENDKDLDKVLEIASTTFTDDRFFVDPLVENYISEERYKRFILKSFEAADEFLYKLTNRNSGEIVAFHNYKKLNDDEILFYLGGVKSNYKKYGLGTILNYFLFNDLKKKKFKRIYTFQSGRNYPIINLEIGFFNFKVVQAYIVLRKIYNDAY